MPCTQFGVTRDVTCGVWRERYTLSDVDEAAADAQGECEGWCPPHAAVQHTTEVVVGSTAAAAASVNTGVQEENRCR